MTTICLIRHGQTDWNAEQRLQGQTDIPLNERGKLQAKECARFLTDAKWDVLLTSPLKRAKQTAEIIQKQVDLPIIEVKAFAEKSFGDAEGMTKVEREKSLLKRPYPNEEEAHAFQERIMKGLETINRDYPDQKVLLVAHGAVIRLILDILSDGELTSNQTVLMNACISNIHFEEMKWKIRDYNQVSHLTS